MILNHREFFPQQKRIRLIQGGHPKIVYLDTSQVRSIVKNLLSNALKFSQAQVEVSLIWRANIVALRFRDYGIGIPDCERSKILRPFYRATNAKEIPGAGIGLSTVKRAVELHNGSIIVDSELNQGTTITVVIPIQMDEYVSNTVNKINQSQNLI